VQTPGIACNAGRFLCGVGLQVAFYLPIISGGNQVDLTKESAIDLI